MGWLDVVMNVVATAITWACWLVVVLSAALCPLLTATVIVELRALRQVVDKLEARPACRCLRHAHPLFRDVEGVEND